jgi:hypothetical protein
MGAGSRFASAAAILQTVVWLSGCGTETGIPSHGGGKRFAIEQELVTASARAALESIDFRPLSGRTVRVVFSSIGDEGSGNLSGGRLSIDRVLGGSYTANPTSRTVFQAATGLLTDGPSGYRSEAFINPRDVDYLSALVTTRLILAGAQVKVNPAAAVDILVLVLTDVYGTIRDRTDYLVYNQERLRARTALEIVAVQASDGLVVLPPRRGAAEAVWEENYVVWTGPVSTNRSVHQLDELIIPPLPATAAGVSRGGLDLAPAAEKPVDTPRDEARPNPLPKPDTKPRTNPPYR